MKKLDITLDNTTLELKETKRGIEFIFYSAYNATVFTTISLDCSIRDRENLAKISSWFGELANKYARDE